MDSKMTKTTEDIGSTEQRIQIVRYRTSVNSVTSVVKKIIQGFYG